MNKVNSWEEAFGQMPEAQSPNDDIKQRQREIQQQSWDNDLPNVNNNLDELGRIKKLLKDNGYDYNDSPLETIKSIIDVNKRLVDQAKRVQQAMSIL